MLNSKKVVLRLSLRFVHIATWMIVGIFVSSSAFAADSNVIPRYDGKTREEFRENMKESVKEMKRFSDDFQRFITDIKEATKDAGWNNFDSGSAPSMGSADIINESNQMNVYVDLPGVSKDDVQVELTDEQTLRIKAKRKVPVGSRDELELNERYDGRLEREVKLPHRADLNKKVKAKLKDGVLSIQIPKAGALATKIVSIDVD